MISCHIAVPLPGAKAVTASSGVTRWIVVTSGKQDGGGWAPHPENKICQLLAEKHRDLSRKSQGSRHSRSVTTRMHVGHQMQQSSCSRANLLNRIKGAKRVRRLREQADKEAKELEMGSSKSRADL